MDGDGEVASADERARAEGIAIALEVTSVRRRQGRVTGRLRDVVLTCRCANQGAQPDERLLEEDGVNPAGEERSGSDNEGPGPEGDSAAGAVTWSHASILSRRGILNCTDATASDAKAKLIALALDVDVFSLFAQDEGDESDDRHNREVDADEHGAAIGLRPQPHRNERSYGGAED